MSTVYNKVLAGLAATNVLFGAVLDLIEDEASADQWITLCAAAMSPLVDAALDQGAPGTTAEEVTRNADLAQLAATDYLETIAKLDVPLPEAVEAILWRGPC